MGRSTDMKNTKGKADEERASAKDPEAGDKISRRNVIAGLTAVVAGTSIAVGNYRCQLGSPLAGKPAKPQDCGEQRDATGHDPLDRKRNPRKLTRRDSNGKSLVLIVCDTFRADCLSGLYDTPNLDRLAQRGVTFTNVYGDIYPTIPMRRNLLTGKSFAVREATEYTWLPIRKKETTLAEYLTSAGITTKALITDNPQFWQEHAFGPPNFQLGWERFEHVRGQIFDHYGDIDRGLDFSRYQPRDLLVKEMSDPESSQFEFWAQYMDSFPEGGVSTREAVDKAIDWIGKNEDRQYALYLDLYGTHPPYDPPEEYLSKHRRREDFPPQWQELERLLWLGHGAVQVEGIRDLDYIRIVQDFYRANIEYTDHCLGRLLGQLDEDTVVVFTSDHGTLLGEEGYLWKSPRHFSPHIAALPLIVSSGAGGYRGRTVDTLVSSVDILPTLLSLLDVDYRSESMDGKNAWDVLDGVTDSLHPHLIMRYPFTESYFAATDGAHYYARDISGNPEASRPILYQLERLSDQGHIRPRKLGRNSYSMEHARALFELLQQELDLTLQEGDIL